MGNLHLCTKYLNNRYRKEEIITAQSYIQLKIKNKIFHFKVLGLSGILK